MRLTDQQLYTLLHENEFVEEAKLKYAEKIAQESGITLYDTLLREDLVTDENLGFLLADYYKVPFITLSKLSISRETLQFIPEEVAKSQRIIAFSQDESGVKVATTDPTNITILDFIAKKVQVPITVCYATENDINNTLHLYAKEIESAFAEVITSQVKQTQGVESEVSVIKIVDLIMSYAYQNKASDVHIEPESDLSLVRFRIDGILHDIVKLPLEVHSYMVIRIKVLASLRTDEHLAPQDGKFQFQTEKELLDIRVSVVPILRGEKIVMRLLSESTRQISLSLLGFSNQDLKKVENAYKKPYGMVLSTGPTGSGKTTTMYALIKLLNTRDVNIMTIEDPIEYDIDGINQIQVSAKTDLSFANGLRSILRQDPNVILVGEIRDEETAGIAINAAMTGHLVLSTLHTNDAATAIPRLFDMNIESFLIASTIHAIIAQRLIRKIHTVCRVSEEVDIATMRKYFDPVMIKKVFGTHKKVRLYKGKGCNVCHDTGYEGRIGMFEVLELNDLIREAIVARKDANTIRTLAVKSGMRTLVEDGLEKVYQGHTTIDEVLRVAKE